MCKKLYFLISFVLVLGLAHPSIVKGGLDNDPNLVGYWKLNEGSGTVAIDSSGNAPLQNGIINGGPPPLTWGTGSPWDGSRFLLFDGTNDWVDINSIPQGKFTLSNYTIAMWFRVDGGSGQRDMFAATSSAGDHGILLEVGHSTRPNGIRYIHRAPYDPGGHGDPEVIWTPSTVIVNDGRWHHLAAVKVSDTSRFLYVDGIQVGSNTNNQPGFTAPARPVLGTLKFNALQRWWNGGIDDVRIYNRSLSATEVGWLAGIGVGYSGKVIGNFEDVNDGWGRWSTAPAGLTVDYNTTGATLAAKSFKMYTPEAGWRTAIYLPLQNRGLIKEFLRNETFSLDVTWVTAEWSSGTSNTWVHVEDLVINAKGIGWAPQGRPDTDSANAGFPGGWDTTNFGEKNTRTITWNYSQYVDGNPDNNEISADANYLELVLVTQYADGFLPANGGYGGIYYFDNAKLIGGDVKAYKPSPSDRATQVKLDDILSWRPGIYAVTHNVYLGTDENTVRDANTAIPRGVLVSQNQSTTTFDPCGAGLMAFNQTYYWRVDEVNNSDPCSPWKGKVWSFTTQDYRDVDDFESYTNTSPNIICQTWRDGLGFPGYPGNGTGSQVGYRDPNYSELTIVHGGGKSMPFDYNNFKSPTIYDSNASRMFDPSQDWTERGAQGVTLWLRGYQKDVGSFTRSGSNPNYIYTMTASGTDIGTKNLRNSLFHDEFHYAYMEVSGDYTIVAKVNSVTNTNASAKAGLMIRDSANDNSTYAMVCITPSNGVWLQYRDTTGGPSFSTTQGGINAPCWLKLQRQNNEPASGYDFIASYSSCGPTGEPNNWQTLGTTTIYYSLMPDPVCIGLSLTAHNAAATCTGVFSGVTVNDETPPSWTHRDIGIKSNSAAPLYVTLQDSGTPAKTATVTHPDPNIVLTGGWQEWNIPLSRFAPVDLTKVKKMTIGVGNKITHQGVGTLYFDDIQLYVPKCDLSKRSAGFARADYYPTSACNTSGDCVVDNRELQIMSGAWLVEDGIITPTTDPSIAGGLLAYYPLNEGSGTTIADAAHDPCHAGTFSASGVSWVSPGLMGNSAIDVNGATGSVISIGTWDPVGPSGGFTLSLWARLARTGGMSQGLIGKRNDWSSNGVRFMFEIFGNNQLRLGSRANGAYSQANIMQQYMCRWAHIAVTFDGTTTTFYLNGQNVGSVTTFTFDPNTTITTTNTMVIGNTQSATWSNEAFNGQLDEVRIYNRALSADEIAYLADLTPGDNKLHISILSPAELYEGESEGSRRVNLRDFAYLAAAWLEEELWPR